MSRPSFTSRAFSWILLLSVLSHGCGKSVAGQVRGDGDGDGDEPGGSAGDGDGDEAGDGDGSADGGKTGDGALSASGGDGSGGDLISSGGGSAPAGGEDGAGGNDVGGTGGMPPVWNPSQVLDATEPDGGSAVENNQQFSSAVAMAPDGSWAAVSAPNEIVGTSSYAGAVYLHQRTGGSFSIVQKIVAPNVETGVSFGASVAMTETLLAVGAPGETDGAGAVYVYALAGNSWTLQERLEKPPESSIVGENLEFGFSVDLFGDTLMVGSPARTYENASPGRVYAYTTDGSSWTFEQELSAVLPNGTSVSIPGDDFGWSIALDEDAVLVGTPGSQSDQGIVYFFRRVAGTWEVHERLPSADIVGSVPRDSGSRFGWSMDLVDDIALVASGDVGDGPRVYVFRYLDATWGFERRLSEDASPSFGRVAFDGEVAVIGAPNDNVSGVASEAGAAYVYRRDDDWGLEQRLLAVGTDGEPEGALGARFGYTVAVAGPTILVGSPGTYVGNAGDAGLLYVFTNE